MSAAWSDEPFVISNRNEAWRQHNDSRVRAKRSAQANDLLGATSPKNADAAIWSRLTAAQYRPDDARVVEAPRTRNRDFGSTSMQSRHIVGSTRMA